MSMTEVIGLTAGLAGGLGMVTYLIAADRTRFLTRFDLSQWRPGYYLRALPNFLQALHDNHFASPWPAAHNAVATACFRLRARPLLKIRAAFLRRAFLTQHITLFGVLETLKPYLRDYFLNEQQRIATARLLEMEDTVERDRLAAFLQAVRAERARFYASLTDPDRATLLAMAERRFVPLLRTAHAIFQEHGYSLLPEFTQLRRWEELSGADLVQELPPMPAPRGRSTPAQRRRSVARRR